MSFVERRRENRPKTGEAPFKVSEVFFSRTDARGVIQAGNYVFRRVAAYEWDQMLGAPHKIIRHPDMPKAVFWLLWDTIKRGEVIGAYVKNLASDGLYYWVFATVMPAEGGYISVRIKPTSPVFELVKKEYAALLQAEKEQGLSPEAAANVLLARIHELGFDDYAQFCAYALSEELTARDAGMEKPVDKNIADSVKAQKVSVELKEETSGLIKDFESMRTIPHNMRVIASRLEPTGGPISTLSQNYGSMSQEISDWFEEHVNGTNSNFSTIGPRISSSMFLRCVARILTEASLQLEMEKRRLGDVDLAKERGLLRGLHNEYVNKSAVEIKNVAEEAGKISNACRIMRRQVLGLSTTRVMCKIEGARTTNQGEGLDDIITQLDTFQSCITTRLERIAHFASRIQSS